MSCESSILAYRVPANTTEDEVSFGLYYDQKVFGFFNKYGKVITVENVTQSSYHYLYDFNDTKSQTYIIHFDTLVDRSEVLSILKHKAFPTSKSSCPMKLCLFEDVQQANKLFIGMIPENTTETELLTLLQDYGEVKEFAIVKKGDSHNKGYGFCHYVQRQDAIKAIKGLHGKSFLHNSTVSLVVKFADTRNQRNHRLQRQKQCKQSHYVSEHNTTKNSTISYHMEYLPEYPPIQFPLCDSFQIQPYCDCDSSNSPYWIDFSKSPAFEQTITYLMYSSRLCCKEDIIGSSCFQSCSYADCDTCVHIFNFPLEFEATPLFLKCRQLCTICDVVIVCRFPFSYGRIECDSRNSAQELFNQLNSINTLNWVLS